MKSYTVKDIGKKLSDIEILVSDLETKIDTLEDTVENQTKMIEKLENENYELKEKIEEYEKIFPELRL
jgi:peptidoglycan hydrolase CwlO-like protein